MEKIKKSRIFFEICNLGGEEPFKKENYVRRCFDSFYAKNGKHIDFTVNRQTGMFVLHFFDKIVNFEKIGGRKKLKNL